MKRIAPVLYFCVVAALRAQDLSVLGHPFYYHGFVSQGFAYSNDNNYLTMSTSKGSLDFTDFGLNLSTPITDKLHVGAQMYGRNLGQLGKWEPALDWAYLDYKHRDWFGLRAGKVKTTLGLYNDTQDITFLHTWAMLPQSMYPLDLRGSSIAHVGGDIYGTIPIKRLGSFEYTAYAGRRPSAPGDGFLYSLDAYTINLNHFTGPLGGADLRWNTPVAGLLLGASVLDQHPGGNGTRGTAPIHERMRKDMTSQFFVQYLRGGLRLDAEYRREYTQRSLDRPDIDRDQRAYYFSGAYRVSKHLELGSYYSRYYVNWQTDLSLPTNHIYDWVVSGRVDITRFWNIKVEGHFINGYGTQSSPHGFYSEENPLGKQPNTNMLVIRTGFNL